MNPEIIGSAAAILTTAAYVPQMIKVLRHRHTRDISLSMYAILTLGIACWFFYGVLIESPSVIWANGLTFLMACVILGCKLRFG